MRSALYVPGNRPDLFAKALTGRCDVVLLDLEDSVPLRDKESARAEVIAWVRSVPAHRSRIWVRVNSGELGNADLAAVAACGPAAVCLAKTESARQVGAAADILDRYESGSHAVRVCPLLETATAIYAAREIAMAPRVLRLQIGEADLCADTGISPGADERELLAVRSQVVLAAAAAGIAAPLAPVRTDFRDLDALRVSTHALRRLGFRGRACVHPAQVPVVNEVFTPSAADLERARALVADFDAAASGVMVDDTGAMVDLAVIRHARRLLEQ
ncbi:HpcH/HpaI aldolase/citrate lyase family protein [Nocardia alba]|uniref:Citrate lyase subunit beta/citryl-CoA lyase n=1 Tax=Nocardia alba TaxID=225051 RepID=A0A4R1FU21_9NOCA|nr:CoA ester lyase [Nocardia alba]TCJ97129.1 citrate lyase subunit beta/citryl-CoA lyase [Nocardia alba]